jgi:hypothetical protein
MCLESAPHVVHRQNTASSAASAATLRLLAITRKCFDDFDSWDFDYGRAIAHCRFDDAFSFDKAQPIGRKR